MKILVINAGSSSLKYQLIDMETEAVMAKGVCERIGIDGSMLTHKAGKEETVIKSPMPDHNEAIRLVLEALVDKKARSCKEHERDWRGGAQNGAFRRGFHRVGARYR